MKKKKKNFWSNPWTIGITGSIVASILLRIFDKIFGTEILTLVFDIILTPFGWIYTIMVVDVSTNIYVLILIFIAGVLVTFTVLFFVLRSDSNQEGLLPPFLNYTEDKMKELSYTWNWVKGYDGKYRVSNIIPMCPKCKCNIVYESCPNCNTNYSGLILNDQSVEALIHHKLKTNFS